MPHTLKLRSAAADVAGSERRAAATFDRGPFPPSAILGGLGWMRSAHAELGARSLYDVRARTELPPCDTIGNLVHARFLQAILEYALLGTEVGELPKALGHLILVG